MLCLFLYSDLLKGCQWFGLDINSTRRCFRVTTACLGRRGRRLAVKATRVQTCHIDLLTQSRTCLGENCNPGPGPCLICILTWIYSGKTTLETGDVARKNCSRNLWI